MVRPLFTFHRLPASPSGAKAPEELAQSDFVAEPDQNCWKRLARIFPKLPHIPNVKEVESIFPMELCDGMNWASEKSTFNLFMQLVDFPAYRSRVLLGVTYAAGGISANLVC
ncbi:Tubulin-specific chaperone D [Portunus trituberculatus]|uniref:Tubulin-specific chaperone D n=1 Tax=Portunus trituberculatus TaxID=210409 RepID=A0A5B7FIY4_PORTR|nr:Tubulin-specific chaperone D [Portunus trituberculatus]